MALLQSNPPAPAEQPILHLFPAWPKEWDASYTLFAREGFTVTASTEAGEVKSLELYSHAGSPCRMRNPYPNAVQLYRNGKQAESLHGSLLESCESTFMKKCASLDSSLSCTIKH
jgi:hypothetical protein